MEKTSITSDDVVNYFSKETDVPKDRLEASIEDGIIYLKAKQWLGDGWYEIMELVDAMDGEWVKDGKDSHWWFDASWMEARIADMKAEEGIK